MTGRCFSLYVLCTLLLSVTLPAQNLMRYTSGMYSYSILIPEDWRRNDAVDNSKIALVMLSDSGATVSVTFHSITGLTTQGFVEKYESSLPGQLEGLAVQEKGIIKSRDDEAPYLVIDFRSQGVMKREKICFYGRAGEVAVVTAGFTTEDFHTMIPVFDRIFKSFTFETRYEKLEAD